jgi:hypothetical protein
VRATLLIGVLALAVHAAPAAAAPQPWPQGSWAIPADGSARTASSWPNATAFEMFDFALYVYAPELVAADKWTVEVASAPALDPDGTLADANRIDAYDAPPRPGSAGIFVARTRVDAEWIARPGLYYWQARYDDWVTPVERLVIVPRPPPDAPAPTDPVTGSPAAPAAPPPGVPAYVRLTALTPHGAHVAIRARIRRATHREPRALRFRCAQPSLYRFLCRPSWRDARHRYRGTMRVTSTAAGVRASFTGTRVCLRRAPSCRRAVRWRPG